MVRFFGNTKLSDLIPLGSQVEYKHGNAIKSTTETTAKAESNRRREVAGDGHRIKRAEATRDHIYDAFLKRMFGQVLVFVDFLVNYGNKHFVDAIDIMKIALAPTHYLGAKGDERIVDLVFTCPLKSGNGTLMAVIIFEHQGGSLKKIPRKLLKYITAIWTAEEKEGKPLSAPYFIVLRTGKKPHRGPYPKMSDSLPKDKDGKPIGKVVEVEYDVIDLPSWDLGQLVGGPVLRATFGLLKKMIEDAGEDFPEAFRPLLELADKEQKVEVTKELLDFVEMAFKARHRKLDEAAVSEVLKTVFPKEKEMIKSIFDEKIAKGKAEGKTEGKTETLLKILRARFKRVPRDVESIISKMTDPIALDSWAVHAAMCESMDEFATAIR